VHPLSVFVESLRADGFQPTLHDYRRINLALQAEGEWQIIQFRDMLAALLVKSPEQDIIFQRRFKAFFKVPEPPELIPTPPKPIPTSPPKPKKPSEPLQPKSLQKSWLKFLLWFGVILLFFSLSSDKINKLPNKGSETQEVSPPLAKSQLSSDKFNQLPKESSETQEVSLPPAKSQRLYPDVPSIKNITPILDPAQDEWKKYAAIAAFLFLVLLAYGVWLWRSRQLPKDNPPVWDCDKPRLFSLGGVGGKPQPRLSPAVLDQLADSIGYFYSDQTSKRIDINNSIRVSVQRLIPTLIFHPRKQIHTVLILEDALAKPLAWNPIAEELANGLRQRGIIVLQGQFYGSLRQFCTAPGTCYDLETLTYESDTYILLIFSDGKSLRYHRDTSTLEALSQKPKVAWMELREVRAWDESTILPAHFGLPIYPATAQGLLQAIGRFLSEYGRQNDLTEVALTARGLPVRIGDNLAAYVEELLGDALPWAQCGAMLQPVSLGLADALRCQFFPHLPPQRIERLFALPNNINTINGLHFSKPIIAILRDGFQLRFTDKQQQEILQFILDKLKEVKPEDEQSPAHLAWEWRYHRVNLELNPDKALQRLAELAGTNLGQAIRTELENTEPPPKKGITTSSPKLIPLRVRPKSKVALQRLQRFAKHSGIKKLSALPVGLVHWVTIGLLTSAFLGAFYLFLRALPPNVDVYDIELVNTENVLAWGALQNNGTVIKNSSEKLTLPIGENRLTFLSNSGFIKTQEINELTENLRVELDYDKSGQVQPCLESFAEIGLTIQRCSSDETTALPLNIPTWRESLKETTPQDRLMSIGLEIQTNPLDDAALQTLRHTLLERHSVDIFYRIAPALDGKLYLPEALAKIKTQLTPWQTKSQLIWWVVGKEANNIQLDDFIAPFGAALNLNQSSDLSWVASVQKRFTSGKLIIIPDGKSTGIPEVEIAMTSGEQAEQRSLIPTPIETFRDKLKDGSLGPEMVWIPAGRFRMGDIQGGGDSDEQPVHEVSVNRFAMGRYEVTFAEYDKFAKANSREKPDDNGWGREQNPVINVCYQDAVVYTQWLVVPTKPWRCVKIIIFKVLIHRICR